MFALLPASWFVPHGPADEPPSPASRSHVTLHPAPLSPVPSGTLEGAIARGVAFLCKTQNGDGSWGSPRWTGGVDQDPVPGAPHSFGVATTALCLEALLDAGDTPEVIMAARRAEAYLMTNLPKLRRADLGNVPNVWGYTYGIQVLAKLAQREPAGSDRRKALEAMIRDQVKGLEHFETVHGGWFYYASGFQRPWPPRPASSTRRCWSRSPAPGPSASPWTAACSIEPSRRPPTSASPTRAISTRCRARSTSRPR